MGKTKKKIAITGSSGMLGTDLCQELRREYEVAGIDIDHGPRTTDHSFYACDITDQKDVREVISKIRPDVLVHAAAWTDVDGCELDKDKAYAVNSGGTENVASACRESGTTLIYISTDFVFDGQKDRPYKENDPTNPLSVYGDSKLKGEAAVRKALKEYFILRTSWLYGKNGKNFVDTIIAKAKEGNTLKVVDDQAGSPTYTKDLAGAIHALLKRLSVAYGVRRTAYGVYHVSNSGCVSWRDYAKEILRIAGIKTEVLPISSAELTRPAKRPAMSVLDNARFRKYTGYKMRGWKEALKEYLKR